jgi:hypothetical protein
MTQLPETAMWLHGIGVKRVVVFGQVPTWTIAQPRVVRTNWNRNRRIVERTFDHLDPSSAALDDAVSRAVAGTGAQFVSPMSKLCDETGCLVALHRQDGMHTVAFDNSHLGTEGSFELVSRSATFLIHRLSLGASRVGAPAQMQAQRPGSRVVTLLANDLTSIDRTS